MQELLKNKTLLRTIGFWLTWWLFWVSGSIYFLRLFNANHLYNAEMTSFYFAIACLASLWIYQDIFLKDLKPILRPQIVLLSIFFIVFILGGWLINKQNPLNENIRIQIMDSKFYFPLLVLPVLFTKAFDVLFQQTLIYALIKKIIKFTDNKLHAVLLFAAAFTLVHLPLFFVFGWLALIFILPSVFAGFIFSFAILYFRQGLTISVLVHLLFYLLIALYLRQFGF